MSIVSPIFGNFAYRSIDLIIWRFFNGKPSTTDDAWVFGLRPSKSDVSEHERFTLSSCTLALVLKLTVNLFKSLLKEITRDDWSAKLYQIKNFKANTNRFSNAYSSAFGPENVQEYQFLPTNFYYIWSWFVVGFAVSHLNITLIHCSALMVTCWMDSKSNASERTPSFLNNYSRRRETHKPFRLENKYCLPQPLTLHLRLSSIYRLLQ